MPESDPVSGEAERTGPSLQEIGDRIDDLGRVLSRQARTLGEIADEQNARATHERAGTDLALLVELAALHGDAAAFAETARSRHERDAFAVIARSLERLIVGRGGLLVTPAPGEDFDASTMEAVEVVGTDDPALDRTVAALRTTGLRLAESGRSLRPAGVVVRRRRS